MARKRPTTIAAYIQSAPPEGRAHLRRLYATLKSVAPEADEVIKWGTPFFVEPRFLFAFSAHKAHLNFAPMEAGLEPFRSELKRHKTTNGLYYPIWFLRRRAALNRLDSPRKLRLWPFVIMMIWFTFQFVVSFLAGLTPRRQPTGEGAALVSGLVRLAVAVLMLVQSFFTKDILEDHLAGPGDQLHNPLFTDTVKLSGPMTFPFQVFYLQYVINRYIIGSKSRAV